MSYELELRAKSWSLVLELGVRSWSWSNSSFFCAPTPTAGLGIAHSHAHCTFLLFSKMGLCNCTFVALFEGKFVQTHFLWLFLKVRLWNGTF